MPFRDWSPCGLSYWHEAGYCVPVPLQSVHLEAKVVSFTAEVTVKQTFTNTEASPIEAIYYFPVEEEAAVVSFTAQLEGRTIK